MDEREFKKTYDSIRDFPCIFEKAILNRQANCSKVRRINLGEREGAACTEWQACKLCKDVLGEMRETARFILKATSIPGPLPHARELRVQVGGISGLQVAHDAGMQGKKVEDISLVLSNAMKQYGSIESLPYQLIMQNIASFASGRKSRSKRK